jgi:hypothetical protein
VLVDILFHSDTTELLGVADLRAAAAEGIRACPLIQRAWLGEPNAIAALHIGFWPFVREFEVAIDKATLPRRPLRDRFGAVEFRQKFGALAEEVREMKREEGSHAAHWKKDAQCFGISDLEAPVVTGVQKLIDISYTKDLTLFFCVLAGTEFVAEELSSFLLSSPEFICQSNRNRWVWGEVHTAHDHDGPSHLEIDLDLARAYQPSPAPEGIRKMVLETVVLFAEAANDIGRCYLAEESLLAAE